jgi:uncharacterized secreted protein with C-terminal beta-propeller domain
MRIAGFQGILYGVVLITMFLGADSQNIVFAQNKTEFASQPKTAENKTMNDSTTAVTEKPVKFYQVLEKILRRRGLKKEDICNEEDVVQMRILHEYGAIFVAGKSAEPPPKCMFTSAVEVEGFQQRIFKAAAEIEGTRIELQTIAMRELLKAREKAVQKDLSITPRGGAEAARRSFEDTLRLWKSRFEPACRYWLKAGRLTASEVKKLKSLPIKEQVREVLELEKQGIYFNTRFDNSILYSVAAPGTSQHLSLLALDVEEFENEKVRKILARYGWFRTVQNDTPHFTFLGRQKRDLKKLGLKKIETKDGEFWIPNVD